ncbi:MAG: tetratricopeptide repeat protein [Thermodesulfovibrionia bacterium]|nr:tetratricopeptide repeat protein [Thermodesulfovibrionia bacterium]MCK5511496.1 tetratricopeptide repeat protein [Thermodesulfovibrionia bacterium]
MRIIIVLTSLLLLFSVSVCTANDGLVQKAYSLYYQGKKEAAIQLMKEYVKDYPDPKALYFLGYAFYEQKDMKTAFKYFKDAYLINPEVSPMTWK